MTTTEAAAICAEVYYPQWSSRGIRGVKCERRAKFEVRRTPYASDEWTLACGVHARKYEQARDLR